MSRQPGRFFIGTAGWSIPKTYDPQFSVEGTHLERYAKVLSGVEINSSFHRPHKSQTYERWAQSVPEDFRFAVKAPKVITHEHRLQDVQEPLTRFLDEISGLGPKLGPILLQLPPSLQFDSAVVSQFFALLRSHFGGEAVCEPRHISWFAPEAEQLLTDFKVARVAADPAIITAASEPGGWAGLVYYRLHGSPRIYYSDYSPEYLADLAEKICKAAEQANTWCIFDNTAGFAATGNALSLLKSLQG